LIIKAFRLSISKRVVLKRIRRWAEEADHLKKNVPEVEPIKHYGARIATGFKGKDITDSVKDAAKRGKISIKQYMLSEMYDLAHYYGYDSNGGARHEAEMVANIINAVNKGNYKNAQRGIDVYEMHLEGVTPRRRKEHWNRAKVT
jgi:hypothetical protein